MKPAANVMPIKNTPRGRKPIVDAIVKAMLGPDMKGEKREEWIYQADRIVTYYHRGLNQIAAGRKVRL